MTILIAKDVIIDLEKMVVQIPGHSDRRIITTSYIPQEIIEEQPILKKWYNQGLLTRIMNQNEPCFVELKDCEQTPKKGYCFQGLLEYEKLATPSDIMLKRELINSPEILDLKDGNFAVELGNTFKLQQYWYLSHPINEIYSPNK